jgi:U3 small nucleolar ribonucleoprotein protein LCP5
MTTNIQEITQSIEETLKKISSSLVPSIRQHVESDNFDHEKDSFDFLDAKNGILLTYLIDLTQYMKLQTKKSEDNRDELNDCISRLQESKTVLEKLRPLEKKMRYQLDKLLALSANSSMFAVTNDETKDTNTGDDDPLAFRPDIESMMKDDDEDDEDGIDNDDGDNQSTNSSDSNSHDSSSSKKQNSSDADDSDMSVDEELMAARSALLAAGRKQSSTNDDEPSKQGVYRAPRLSATPFMEEKEKQAYKEERIAKRQKDRMRKSELLSTLKYTFGDAPEEDDFDGGATIGKQREATQRFMAREEEKNRFEEDAMVRLTVSRKDKKMRNKIMRDEISNLNSITDLGNLTVGVNEAFGSNKKGGNDKEERIQVESRSTLRHANGKRRRESDGMSESSKKSSHKPAPKNSFQKALYGMEGGGRKSGAKKNKK